MQKMQKILAAILAVLMLLSLTACGKKKTTAENTSTAPSTSKTERTDAPVIDPGSLYNYTSGIASNYTCEVSEPTVSGDTAVYQVSTSKEERFANMTGTYELVLTREEASGTWKRDNDRSQWAETAYSLNPEEFYSEEYYWTAYPLSPTKSDPICLTVTDISDSECTLEWWSEGYGYTQINGSCEGSGTFALIREDESESSPCWVIQGVELTSVKSNYSKKIPLTFRFEITPEHFSIAPTNDTGKYVGTQRNPLSRIKNEAYYAAALEEVLRSGAHMQDAREAEDDLWTYSELIWDEDTIQNGSIELDGFRYVGALLMTEGNGYADRLFFIYGALVSMTVDNGYEPRLITTYYPVFVKDAAVKDGALTYTSFDLDYSTMDARETHAYLTTGGSVHALIKGSATVEDLLDYYGRQYGGMFGSITYIASSDDSDPDVQEYAEWLRGYEPGKLGISFAEDTCRITQVVEGGAAANAGVCVGDVLVAMNGNALPTDSYSVSKILVNAGSMETELTFRRDGAEYTVTLKRLPAD